MGLFDAFKEKAADLLSGASDKVSELTGTDLSDAHQNVTDTAQNVGDTATDTAQNLGDTATGAGQDLAGHATDTAQNVTDPVFDSPVGEHIDPRGQQ